MPRRSAATLPEHDGRVLAAVASSRKRPDATLPPRVSSRSVSTALTLMPPDWLDGTRSVR